MKGENSVKSVPKTGRAEDPDQNIYQGRKARPASTNCQEIGIQKRGDIEASNKVRRRRAKLTKDEDEMIKKEQEKRKKKKRRESPGEQHQLHEISSKEKESMERKKKIAEKTKAKARKGSGNS